MKFHYRLTDKAQDDVFIATGKRPGFVSTLELSDTDLTPDQRARCVAAGRNGYVNIGPLTLNWQGDVITGDLDTAPTAETVWSLLDQMDAERPAKEAESQAFKDKRHADHVAFLEQQKAAREVEAEARQQRIALALKQQEEQRAAARHIEWKDGKAIVDLRSRLFILSEDEQDDRFDNRALTVTDIDRTAKNGYMFLGTFVPAGTIEITNERRVYLVASTSGSRKYAHTYYRVIVLQDGVLTRTDLTTSNKTPGWALRLREPIQALLNA